MLDLNTTQLSIIQSDYKKVSWLFTIVDSAGPTTYYWSTITRSYGEHSYVYKINPDTFFGITLNSGKSEYNIQAPNDLSFVVNNSKNILSAGDFIDGSVLVKLVISDGTNEEIIAKWKFNIERCEAEYQTLRFTCQDFLQRHLTDVYPAQLVKDISPSDDPDRDDLCVPVPIGTAYIPLRSLYITNQRYYLLGPTAGGKTYTISKVHAPRKRGNSEWDSGDYSFTQSTKTLDTVDWRVFQAIIADSNGDGSADANGLWLDGTYFLDMLTKFSRSDSSGKTNPADAIEFILEDMGIASGDIDTGVGSSFESAKTTYTSWGLTFNGGYFYGKPKEQILSQLLTMCHSTLQVTDKIELHVLSKTSQKTITKADVLRTSDKGPGTFRYSLITGKQSDSGYIAFQIADEPQDEFIKKLVPAKTTTDNILNEVLEIPFVQDTQDVQRIGTLYYQRLFLPEANISFTNKGATFLALQPNDMITINHADYGGNYPICIDSMTIRHDLSIDFNCIRFSASLDDWTDLSPSVITPETDDSSFYWNASGNRVFSVQPYPPYDVGDLWMQGPAGDIMVCITARNSGVYEAGDWDLASQYNNRRVFHSQPSPPYELGDLWTEGVAGDIMVCIVARATGVYHAADWELASEYDKTGTHTALNTTYVNDSDTQSGYTHDVHGDVKMRSGKDILFYDTIGNYRGQILSAGASGMQFNSINCDMRFGTGAYKMYVTTVELSPTTDKTMNLGAYNLSWSQLFVGNMKIFNDGSWNRIDIASHNFLLWNADNSHSMIEAKRAAEVSLWYNGAKKLQTSNTGITVTGSCSGCDYVFENDYDLMSLSDLQAYITKNMCLPEMTINRGINIDLSKFRQESIEKIEELTLYILQLHARLKGLES